LKQKALVLTITLIAVILVSLLVTIKLVSEPQFPEFFVGVEFAYSYGNVSDYRAMVSDLKILVDKVKNYTNLFVIGTPELAFKQTILNETCDYIYNAGLYFIVLFTSPLPLEGEPPQYDYNPYVWIIKAKQKYGDRLLAVYRYDEPGGNQLDNGTSHLFTEAENYTDAAQKYVDLLNIHLEYYLYSGADVLTSDYGLYWFDYKGGYNAVLAEFGSNHSRELNVALCRGAAKAQNKDWGAILTWTYNDKPYIESGEKLYEDMTLAYDAGAKYMVIFDYPKIGQYGILTKEHFDALEKFWNYIHSNPQNYGANQARVAYILPQDYGFGFRRVNDNIWGLWNADDLSLKVWDDANNLISQYNSRFDIVYNDPEFINAIISRYDKLIFWNETVA
jgi:hypothetical protein